MFRGRHHCASDHFIVKWKSKSDSSDCLHNLDNLVKTHSHFKAVTLAAMKEAESDAMNDVPSLDMSSIEAMEKSMGL